MLPEPRQLTADDLAELPLFPLPNATLFPGTPLPLFVFEPRYLALVRDALRGRRVLAVPRLKPGFESEYEARPPVFEVCGVGVIADHHERPDGRYEILIHGVARARIVSEYPPIKAYRLVEAELLPDLPSSPALVQALRVKLRGLWRELGPHLPLHARDLDTLSEQSEEAGLYSNRLAAALLADPDSRQLVLEERDPGERLRLLIERLEELLTALALDPESVKQRLN